MRVSVLFIKRLLQQNVIDAFIAVIIGYKQWL